MYLDEHGDSMVDSALPQAGLSDAMHILEQQLFEPEGIVKATLQLCLDGYPDAALAMLERHAQRLLDANAQTTLLNLIQNLPVEHYMASANCQYWLGLSLPATNLSGKLVSFELACSLYEAKGQISETILCLSEIAMLLCQSGIAGAKTSACLQRLQMLIVANESAVAHHIQLTAYSALTRSMHFGEFADHHVQRWAVRLARLLAHSTHLENSIKGATALLLFYVHFGFPMRAQQVIMQFGYAIDALAVAPLTKVWWYIICGQHYFVNGKRSISLEMLDCGHKVATATGLSFVENNILIHKLYTCLGAGDLSMATSLIRRIENTVNPLSVVEQVFASGGLAWHALLCNRPADALPHAQTIYRLASNLSMPIALGYSLLVMTATLIANDDRVRAEKMFIKLKKNNLMYKSDFFSPHVLLLEARLAILRGDRQSALEKLRSAFLVARESQVMAPIFWLPDVMADQCARALEQRVEVEFVTSLIKSRSLVPAKHVAVDTWPWPLRIHAFGSFSLYRDGEEVIFWGKAQRRPLELLKAIIAFGADAVDVAFLTHLIWPDAEGDAAQSSFHSTLHRLRKLIGYDEAIVLSDRKVSLNFDLCWVDVVAFERLVDTYLLDENGVLGAATVVQWRERVNRVFAVYRSHFLVSDELQLWSMPMRDKLRSKFLRFVVSVGDHLEQLGQSEDAIELYQRGLEVDCLAEELYRGLMECCRLRGELAEAFGVYRRCRETLSVILGVAPSEKTNQLYRELTAES